MNFALSDEQVLLREAARGSLARVKTVEAARTALEDPAVAARPVAGGRRGRLAGRAHRTRSAAAPAWAASTRCWWPRSAAGCWPSVPILGLLPATAILDAAGDAALEAVAAGELRPAYVPARPPERARAGAGRPSPRPALTARRRRA